MIVGDFKITHSLQKRVDGLLHLKLKTGYLDSSTTACAAASLAMGTRNGEQLT